MSITMTSRKKIYLKIVFSISFILIFTSCKNELETLKITKSRFVLVYMIADNDLDYFAIQNINDMELGFKANENGDLFVYIDRASNTLPSHPYLLKISHDTTNVVTSKIVQTYPEQNSSDANILKKVLSDALLASDKTYSSMGLVLWSHGSAWLPSGTSLYSNRGDIFDSVSQSNRQKSFGLDFQTQSKYAVNEEMDIKSLAEVLDNYKFEFILFDACFMASVEVAYELRNSNKYFIASPIEVLSSGFPYNIIVPQLFKDELDPKSIAQSYYNYYSNQKGILNSGAVCAINSSELNELARVVNELCSKSGTVQIDRLSNTLNIDSIQQYDRLKVGVLFDLKQFLGIESSAIGDEVLKTSIGGIWDKTIIAEYHTSNVLGTLSLKNCNGLSTFLPHKTSINVNNYYKTLSWYKASGYNKVFLDIY